MRTSDQEAVVLRLPRQKPLAALALLVGTVALAAGLSACTTETPSPSGSATQSISSPTSATPSGTPTPTPVIEPVLVVASVDVDGKNVSASGYVQGVVEDGGSCVFSYEREGATVTADHEGAADRMTTSCGLVQSPIDEFVRGTWNLTLSYATQGKTYTSQPTTVEIP
ncbi:hypothetical protein [Leifsonia poae]|uniref:hypothetical protein n=1 Tax=Leifsonia poae TaxID=110933 RepID=UPI003D66DD85